MQEIVNLIAPGGLFDLASMIRMFILIAGMDGVAMVIYAVIKGASGR